MGVGIQFSANGAQRTSILIDGQPLTAAAGGFDDGVPLNGAHITVGSGDGDNVALPLSKTDISADDDEYYGLALHFGASQQALQEFTATFNNPSADDQLFLLTLESSKPLVATIQIQGEGTSICKGQATKLSVQVSRSLGGGPFLPLSDFPMEVLVLNPAQQVVATGNTDNNGRYEYTTLALDVSTFYIFQTADGVTSKRLDVTVKNPSACQSLSLTGAEACPLEQVEVFATLSNTVGTNSVVGIQITLGADVALTNTLGTAVFQLPLIPSTITATAYGGALNASGELTAKDPTLCGVGPCPPVQASPEVDAQGRKYWVSRAPCSGPESKSVQITFPTPFEYED